VKQRILLLAPYFREDSRWIDDFCARPDLEFRKAPFPTRLPPWHQRGGATPAGEWLAYLRYTGAALRWPCDCVVSSFPQLALAASALLPLRARRPARLIAWNFNVGSLASRLKGRIAGRLLGRVDRFVVHARGEVSEYARWLGLEEARFRFVPLQRGRIGELPPSPIAGPYVVSMGSANRDYATLAAAVAGTGIRTVIIGGPELVRALPPHPEIVGLHGLGFDECNAILASAAVNVVPITDGRTASGQVTFTTAMRLGVATVATRCVGTVDYIRDGATGMLVPPGDPTALRAAIELLWHDPDLRRCLGEAARRHADAEFSDEAAGRHLAQAIDEVLAA
jgi:glycosyltransferase involved in cell wall biosynthesis